jgi:multiple sugar transport system permease protein
MQAIGLYGSIPGLVFVHIVYGIPITTLIFRNYYATVPGELVEAARIDGAGYLRLVRHITIPMMSPVILFNLIAGIIDSFQTFTPAFLMTNGGPANASLFYGLYLYNNAFKWFKMGYASALAWLMFVIILLLTGLVFRSSIRWVYYEGGLRR